MRLAGNRAIPAPDALALRIHRLFAAAYFAAPAAEGPLPGMIGELPLSFEDFSSSVCERLDGDVSLLNFLGEHFLKVRICVCM